MYKNQKAHVNLWVKINYFMFRSRNVISQKTQTTKPTGQKVIFVA